MWIHFLINHSVLCSLCAVFFRVICVFVSGSACLACSLAVALLFQVQAESSVFVRDSEHLYTAAADDAASALAEEDVSFLVSRLAGTRSPLESKPPTGLPVADIFDAPTASLMLVVTGAEVSTIEGASTQFALEDTSSTAKEAIKTMLTGNTAQRTVSASVCASLDAAVGHACGDDATVVSWDENSQAFVVSDSEPITVDTLFSDSSFFSTVGVKVTSDTTAVHTNTGTEFDLTESSTMKLFAELQLFNQLPQLLNVSDAVQQFSLLSLVGPQIYTDVHGSDDASLRAVDAIVAEAASTILDSWSDALGDDIFETAVVRHNAEPTAAGRRRVLTTASTTDLYTFDQVRRSWP